MSQTCVEILGLYYSTKATGAAGVTPPAASASAWGWDDLVQAADKLTMDSAGRHPSQSGFTATSVKQYGLSAPTGLLQLTALLKSNGVELFDAAGTKTNLDSPAAITVLRQVADLIFKHRVSPTPAQATTFGASTALLLASGRVAMAIDGNWALLDMQTSKVPYDVGVLPKFGQPYTTMVSGANAVFAGSKHKEAGLQLLLQLADPAKVPLYANGLWMPLEKKYYTDEKLISSWAVNAAHPKSYRTAFVDTALNNTVSYPAYKVKNFSIIETTINNGLLPIFTKKTDVAAHVQALARQVNKLMQGSYPDTAA